MSDGKVTMFPTPYEKVTPEMALLEAGQENLTSVLVLGYLPSGEFYSISGGGVTRADALWLVEHARMNTLCIGPYADGDK